MPTKVAVYDITTPTPKQHLSAYPCSSNQNQILVPLISNDYQLTRVLLLKINLGGLTYDNIEQVASPQNYLLTTITAPGGTPMSAQLIGTPSAVTACSAAILFPSILK